MSNRITHQSARPRRKSIPRIQLYLTTLLLTLLTVCGLSALWLVFRNAKFLRTEYLDSKRLDLSGKNLRRSAFRYSDFSNATLNNSDFSDSAFYGVNFAHVSSWGSCFKNSTFVAFRAPFAKFSQSILTNVDMEYADLHDCAFSTCDLRKANFRWAHLTSTRFEDTNLTSARLERASLVDTYLAGVNLRDADLRYASLRHATLTNTELNGADLCGADLSGASLTDVTGALFDGNTKWPAGFDPLIHGAKTVKSERRFPDFRIRNPFK